MDTPINVKVTELLSVCADCIDEIEAAAGIFDYTTLDCSTPGCHYYNDPDAYADETPAVTADCRWMLGLGTRKELDAYLGFGSVLCRPVFAARSGREVWIIRADSQHNAMWQSQRLQSGMRGGVVLLHSFDDAVAEAERLAAVL
jgi:hypothetical protein